MILTNSIIYFVLLLFFVIRTTGIAEFITTIWVVPLFFIFSFSFCLVLKNTRYSLWFLFKESKWISLSLVILIVNKLCDHGNFKLDCTLLYLIMSIPFYIIGYYWAINYKYKYFKKLVVSYFVFLSLYLFSKIIQVRDLSIISRDTLRPFFYLQTDNNLIFFWPYAAFVFVIAIALLLNNSKRMIYPISTCFFGFICIVSFMLSGAAAPIVLILFTVFIYFILKSISKNKIKLIFSLPVYFVSAYCGVYLLGSGIVGTFGGTTHKLAGLLVYINTGSLYSKEIFNVTTSDRWTAGIYSISQFIKNPIWGNGGYLETVAGMLGDFDKYTSISGGHSFVLDTLAYYGIFGIPIILILYKFFIDGFKCSKLYSANDKFVPRVYTSLILSLFISNILNTTFLFSNFDNFVFLCAGFFLGRYYILQHNPKLRIEIR